MYMLTQAKDYKGMNILSSDQSIPCFQKLLDFVPAKLSKKCKKKQPSTPSSFSFLQRSYPNLTKYLSLKKELAETTLNKAIQ